MAPPTPTSDDYSRACSPRRRIPGAGCLYRDLIMAQEAAMPAEKQESGTLSLGGEARGGRFCPRLSARPLAPPLSGTKRKPRASFVDAGAPTAYLLIRERCFVSDDRESAGALFGRSGFGDLPCLGARTLRGGRDDRL